MKILFSNYAILDSNGFARSFMLARELVFLGNEVTFLTTLPSNSFIFPYKKENRDGLIIYAFPDIIPNFMRRTGFGIMSFIFKILFVFKEKYDIYHSDVGHRPCGGIPIHLKRLFFKIKYVSEWYNYYGRGGQYDIKKGIRKITHGKYDLLMEVRDRKAADGVVCLSSAMAERARQEGIQDSRVRVIHGGADVRSIGFHESSKNKARFNIPEDSLTFGFIGMNITQIKDIQPFIDAMNELSEFDDRFKKATMLTTGYILPDNLKNNLHIKFNFIEFGWIDYNSYSELLSCVDCFVLLQQPTLDNKTRWPNRLGDYMAAGRKTIINPFGETIEITEKFKNLFIEVSFNKESIKEQLLKLSSNGNLFDQRAEIRKVAENYMSWEQKARELNGFYDKILQS